MRALFSVPVSVVLAACLAGPVHAADTDVDAIRRLVQQFQSAIVAHDGATLGSLFVQEGGSWLSVLDDPATNKLVPSTWRKFADFVQHSDKPIEERFYDVHIDANGTVAAVWFDYDFRVDGKVTNRGSETWQLVRTGDGWKIQAMLYSIGR